MNDASKKYYFSKLTIMIFKMFGLAPFNVRKPGNVNGSSKDTWQVNAYPQFVISPIGRLYNCCLICVQLYMCCFHAIPMQVYETYPGKSELTAMLELCLTICGNSVVVVIWLMYCIKQNDLLILINRLTRVHATLERINNSDSAGCKKKSGLRNCLILFAVNIVVWSQVLLCEHFAFHAPLITWFAFVSVNIFVNWFIVQYFVALKFIEDRLRCLNDVLRDCCTMNSVVFSLRCFLIDRVAIDDLQLPKIVSLRRAHTCLYEISCGIANFYSLPILGSVAFVSMLTMYNAYYLFMPFVIVTEEETTLMIVNSIVWIVVLMVPIGMLTAGAVGVSNEMKRTAYVIPDILARRTTSSQDKIELQMFSFELLNKDVEFTAYNFFPLDQKLVPSVLGMIATYLTIIFQLQVGNSSNSIEPNITNVNATASRALNEQLIVNKDKF